MESAPEDPLRNSSETVYATFELVIPAASDEALQILKLLSFMRSQQFPFRILLAAIVNPQRQLRAEEELKKASTASTSQRRSWDQTPRDLLRRLYRFLEQLAERAVVPNIIRSLRDAEAEEAQDQLRIILTGLRGLALIDHNDEDDTYCMHSSVKW